MASCDIIDIKCIFVNEIVGSVTLALIIAVIIYFIIASKLKMGFDSTLGLIVPLLIILAVAIGQFSGILAFATLIVGILVGWMFDSIMNK